MLMLLLMLIPSGEPWGASQGNQGRAARGTGGPPGGPVEVLGFGEGGRAGSRARSGWHTWSQFIVKLAISTIGLKTAM